MAEGANRNGLPGIRDELGALLDDQAWIFGEEPDQLIAVRQCEIRARERAFADEVALRLADHPVEPEVVRRDRAVRFLPDDDKATLRAQHVHRFRSIRGDALGKLRPQPRAMAPGNVDLETRLAGE